MSGAENQKGGEWTAGFRAIAGQIPRASLRATLTYRAHPRFSLGVEYNPRARSQATGRMVRAGKAAPLANALVIAETADRPALIVGTSSDRIGTPSGQSFYGTFSKNLKRETKLPIAPYGGVAYGTYEHRWRPIGGLNIGFTENIQSLVIFDGVHVHPLLTFGFGRHSISAIFVRGRHPGASYSATF